MAAGKGASAAGKRDAAVVYSLGDLAANEVWAGKRDFVEGRVGRLVSKERGSEAARRIKIGEKNRIMVNVEGDTKGCVRIEVEEREGKVEEC